MSDQTLRDHLLYLLQGGGAHLSFEEAVADLPEQLRGRKPDRVPYSPWQLIEHMRLAQWDILEYSRDPQHISPPFPDGYWPEEDAPPSPQDWEESLETFQADLQAMCDLVADPQTDLLAPIAHGDGRHTILREALLVADHNAYHLGQLIVVRRALGAWPG